ncbi:hypothetical protein EZV62_025621 [Acer yangbiense]|uniref:Uncharacterized protein n=1 Tax=Acer yangbiense TaxID=1000413 RepID=A0A5C7H0E3_9ROSI|nr:hypothetical protein EZV62_025621 [Acer yangbiense]
MSPVGLWCNKESLPKDSPLSDLPIEGLSYVSNCKKYNVHVYCAIRMMLQQCEKGVHLRNSLKQSIQGFLETYLGGILKRQRRRRKIAMCFVIIHLVLELVSAVLDQVSSSVNKTQCALFGALYHFHGIIIEIKDESILVPLRILLE